MPGGGVIGLGIIGEENMACHTIKTAILIDALLWTLQYDSRRIWWSWLGSLWGIYEIQGRSPAATIMLPATPHLEATYQLHLHQIVPAYGIFFSKFVHEKANSSK